MPQWAKLKGGARSVGHWLRERKVPRDFVVLATKVYLSVNCIRFEILGLFFLVYNIFGAAFYACA